MTVNRIAKKLGIKPGMRILVVAAPSGYLKMLEPLPEGVVASNAAASGAYPLLQFFATRKSEIRKSVPALLKHAAPGALVWITYPKKTSGRATDLSREAVWEVMRGTAGGQWLSLPSTKSGPRSASGPQWARDHAKPNGGRRRRVPHKAPASGQAS